MTIRTSAAGNSRSSGIAMRRSTIAVGKSSTSGAKMDDRIYAISARRSSAGFTLIELLVVLAIILAVTAIVLPSFGGGSGTELRAAARSLAAGLRKTRSSAMTTNRTQVLMLDVERGIFRIAGDTRARSLPARVEISLYTARSELLEGESAGAIRFFPDGSSTGGRITVSSARGRLLVDVDWLTGIVRIIDAARSGD